MSVYGFCRRAPALFAVGLALSAAAPVRAHPTAPEMIAAIDRLLAERPGDARLWLARAHAWRDLGAADHALADLARAERLDPALAEVDLARGLTRLAAGDAAGAESDLDRFLARRPGHVQGLVERARARAAAGELAASAADYAAARAALEWPDPGWVSEEIVVLRRLGDDAAALAVLEDAAGRLGPLPAFVDAAVALELARDRGDAALAWIDRALAAAGDRATLLARRADLELRLGHDAAATADYRAAWAALRARPAHRRATRALDELDARLRAALVGLGQPDPLHAICAPEPLFPDRSLR